MFKIGDYAVYKSDVCTIKDIIQKENGEYYALIPIKDKSLTINILTENKLGLLRSVMNKEEALSLINEIPNIVAIDVPDKLMEYEYKNLMKTGKREDLIKIIKTTYLRNEIRLNDGKKISERDNNYFNNAEKVLYNELALALDMSYDDCREYVVSKVEEINKAREI